MPSRRPPPRTEEMVSHLRSLEPSARGGVLLVLWLNAVVGLAGQVGCAVTALALIRRIWRARALGLSTAVRMARPTRLGVALVGVVAYRLGTRWAVRRWFAGRIRRQDG